MAHYNVSLSCPVIYTWTKTLAIHVYASFAKNHLWESKENDFILLDLGFLIGKMGKSSLILLNSQGATIKIIYENIRESIMYKHDTFGKTTFNQKHEKILFS